ncbi:hypothetical protein ABZV92_19910 [Streptomyces rubiginosohelvolus]|uniref:hypothetical protein n=1 Tax=Streptomyces rubiginosohelvolus TaxID=67362 RepID=UPI0033AAD109
MALVPVQLDPSHCPLIVGTRSAAHFGDLPPGAFESDARPVLASEVRAGDLILASFSHFPTPGRMTRGSTWVNRPYVADEPRPWNPACPCDLCTVERQWSEPDPRVRLATVPADPRWATGQGCDVWWADEPVLVIPAARLLPVPAPE